MGKNKLFVGIVVGAVIGGLVTLTDKSTRDYTKGKLQYVSNKSREAIQNPSDVIRSAKTSFDQFNDTLQNGANNAINALEQVENTMERLSKKRKGN
ncbi:MAG TPA: YtxH domain-containing protein [Bacillota bacterium]|nr:YtxH domain-containing protein [Bacillota bacterium]